MKVNISQLLTVAVLQFIINDKTLHLLFNFIHWELSIIKFVKYESTVYQHQGMLLQNLYRLYLCIVIRLLKCKDLEQKILAFPNCEKK